MKTRYVKSPEDVARILEAYRAPAFLETRSIATSFLTEPEVVAELLPPPLAPAPEPRVYLSVYTIGRSNCVGPFDGASINLACTYQGEPGLYCLAMPMTTDTAVIFGRELYAEPKKLAEVGFAVHGRHVQGSVRRHGVTYIELHATLDSDPAPADRRTRSAHYYFKYVLRADGAGLDGDAQLVRVTHTGRTTRLATGTCNLALRESAHDPVIDLPVLQLEGATYSEGETHTRGEVVGHVPGAQFLPYAFARSDDLTAWLDVAAAEMATA